MARDLGVSPETVREMEQRVSSQDAAFDMGREADDEADALSPAAYLASPEADPANVLEQADWDEHSQQRLSQALEALDARSRDILQQRWLSEDKATLQELAGKYQVSAERIRQLEQNAIRKLRNTLVA